MDLEMLKTRAAIIQKIRSFFDDKGYLELDTPLLCADLIPESCLEVFQTERLFPKRSRKESRLLYLIPSPEIWMKKIIAHHRVNVYQICKCFRNGESSGRLHSSEFTMLEYYTMDADYTDSLKLTEDLFDFLAAELHRERDENFFCREEAQRKTKEEKDKICLYAPFERITVADAFKKYAGFDLFEAAEKGTGAMAEKARELGLDPMPEMTVPEIYDLIFIHSVEPNLKAEKPVVLFDYPAFVPCLAGVRDHGSEIGDRTVERWELYYNGIELANCFSEETDPQKVKEFFINEEAEKERTAIVKHKVDHDYWKLFEQKEKQGFPRCSGVAMGVDRLIMALTERSSIDSVLMSNY